MAAHFAIRAGSWKSAFGDPQNARFWPARAVSPTPQATVAQWLTLWPTTLVYPTPPANEAKRLAGMMGATEVHLTPPATEVYLKPPATCRATADRALAATHIARVIRELSESSSRRRLKKNLAKKN